MLKFIIVLILAALCGGSDFNFDKNILRTIGEHLSENEELVNTRCTLDILYVLTSFPKINPTIQMFDAAGKLPSGLTSGNINNLGHYDQCVRIKHTKPTNNQILKGKYCLAKIPLISSPTKNSIDAIYTDNEFTPRLAQINRDPLGRTTLNLAICIPHTCDGEDIESLFKNININSSIMVLEDECSTDEGFPLSVGDWVAIGILSLFALLIILSTVYDESTKFLKIENRKDLLLSFSLTTNTRRLFKINKNSGSLKCVHGIRTLSMFWVILAHRYSFSALFPSISVFQVLNWASSTDSMIIIGARVSVDSFLLLSGLLLSYVFFKTMEKTKSFNVIMFYVHRHFRLTPLFAMIILLQATLFKHGGSGPLYHAQTKHLVEDCQKYWWPALLYVQNYVHPKNLCIGQSWYLAVDMQLYYLSPLILYPLYKSRKYGLVNLSIWILAFLTTLVTIVYYNNWTAASLPITPGSENRLYEWYIPTHMRAMPWLIGIAMGYFIYLTSKKHIKINKIAVVICWILSFAIMGSIVFGMESFMSLNHVPTKLEDGTYNAFHRIGWSIALAWMIFACVHGYGGPVNWFLSLKIWELIGRLSYSAYLVHLQIIIWYSSTLRVIPDFSHTTLIYTFFGDVILTFIIAYFMTLMFESPIGVLEKIIFNREKPKTVDVTKITEDKVETTLDEHIPEIKHINEKHYD